MEDAPVTPSDDVQAARKVVADLVNQTRLREAQAQCASARDAFPTDTWLATIQSYVLLRLGESEQAAQVAAEAIALGSEDPLAVLVLGTAHRNRHRHAPAAEALLKACRLFPDRLDAAVMLIEETVAAYGCEAAKPVFDEVFGRLPDHSLAVLWGRLLFAEGLHDDMPPGVMSAPILSVEAWLAQAGATPDVVGIRETIRLEEPPVFGEPDAERFAGAVPGYVRYATILRGATIFAKSSLVLTSDGSVLNDTLADARFGEFLTLNHDPVVLLTNGERLLLDLEKHKVEDIDAGVMLSGWGSEHFGHWVPEYLGRLAYLVGHPRFAHLPIIVDSDMPPQHLEYLAMLVPGRIVQIQPGGGLRCGELLVASPSCFFPINLEPGHTVPQENQGGLPTDSLRFIQETVLQHAPTPFVRGRKLYLSRKTRQWRRLLNEDEISAALAARGFEVLFPEEMSFAEQVAMFQSAEVVVAPNGSSLLNAVFAPTDLKLIVLSQRGLFNWATFYGPMRELGYDLVFLCSELETNQKHGDYAIPLPNLIAALESQSS